MPPGAHLSPPWGASSSPLPSAPLLIPVDDTHTMQLTDSSDTSSTNNKQKDDKLPHDASVFVGSLPSNMDQGDLTRLLMEHLSEHTQIRNIKVVRDSKGGVCAFVQCENANSATSLIQTLHSSVPKPFLGRILRYEPARAFRSLLVSYRTPTQYVPSNGANMPSFIHNEIELDLPASMRIWKHRNSRFHSILYNSEAVQAEETSVSGTPDASVLDNVLYLHPLKFDEKSLRRLASYFGPLEIFTSMQALNTDDPNGDPQRHMLLESYPEPHRSPRSPTMDSMCWEIKWEHRDDCVSALMTLRRVPHLTVTWAHQPNSSRQGANLPDYRQNFQSYSPHNRHRTFTHQSFAPHRMHVTHYQHLMEPGESADNQANAHRIVPVLNQIYDHDLNEATHDSWADDSNSTATRKENTSSGNVEDGKDTSSLLDQSPRIERRASVPEILTEEPSQKRLSTDENQSTRNLAGENSTEYINTADSEGQDLYVPPTPALDTSMITPATPGSHFPITPTSSGAYSVKAFDYKDPYDISKGTRAERDIDPTTLFVGGLEMFGPGAWNEEKVKAFFSRFGGLECVKVVRPMNSCAAFAFVKFDNTEAPARAVFEEHNRVYEGRAMRVQLRDCNPPRNNWKYNRGRGGRPHQHHFGVPRRIHYRLAFNAQERPSFPMNQEKPSFLDTNLAPQSQPLPHPHGPPVVVRLPRDDIPSTSSVIEPSTLSVDVSSSARNSPLGERYREWYDEPESPVRTPEPSPLRSSASTTEIPFSTSPSYGYPVTNGPYFPPPSWVHPYPPHIPYQIPYYPGYSVYPPTAVQPPQMLTSPPGSEASGPATGLHHNWPPVGMYTSYIPYSTMPSRTQLVEQGQSQSHIATQAPVVPTGFIQNEQGTLIAVYQPEALDQYLAGTVPTVSMTPSGVISSQQRWDYSTLQFYEPGNTTSINAFVSQQNRPKSAGFHAPPSQQSTTPPREIDNNANPPLYRRQGPGRRESQHVHGFTRQPNHTRPVHNGRPTRAHMHYPANIHTADLGHHSAQPAISADWNRWNNAR